MIKKAVKVFDAEVVMEYSSTPNVVPLGMARNEMTLYVSEDGTEGSINWEYELEDDEEAGEGVDIGLWFDGMNVTGYDGVFELPKQAIELLKENGYNTDEVE